MQSANVCHIYLTLLGITGAVVRDVHPEKVYPIFVTLVALLISGAVVREVHPSNV